MRGELHRNALPNGFKLLGEYEIESMLGHGGFGITYLAKDLKLDHQVAIKEYLPNELAVRDGVSTVYAKSTTDEEAFGWGLQRFIMEAQTLARFHHAGIIRVLRFFEANHTAYMVMEYQDGENLASYLKTHSLSEEQLLQFIQPLLDGLEEIHQTGFLHRDIKPDNIYVRTDGSPVLLDFGAARYAVRQKSTSLTSIITPGYAAFEQYDDKSPQGAWSDIYSLGGVLYYIVSGNRPHEAVGRLRRDEMPRTADVAKGKYNPGFLQAIDWALTLDEQARPQSVTEWRQALFAQPINLLSTPQPGSIPRSPRQPPQTWLLVLLLLTLPAGYLLHQAVSSDSFNEWAATLPQKQPLIVINQERVQRFVQSYFDANNREDIPALLEHYAEPVNYYKETGASKSMIRFDKEDYFKLWPQLNYALSGDIVINDTDKAYIKTVEIPFEFQVYNPERETEYKGLRGRAVRLLTLKVIPNEGLKIIQEREHVFKKYTQKIYP